MKLAARIAAAALLCAASPFAAALSQPMGQTVEIVNQCPHDITIRAKGLFNPWRKSSTPHAGSWRPYAGNAIFLLLLRADNHLRVPGDGLLRSGTVS